MSGLTCLIPVLPTTFGKACLYIGSLFILEKFEAFINATANFSYLTQASKVPFKNTTINLTTLTSTFVSLAVAGLVVNYTNEKKNKHSLNV